MRAENDVNPSNPKQTLTVALAGNPNSGKTTLFNALTGARHHVANYPGVTVETMEGTVRHKGIEIRLVDLPGTYSLTAYSEEELLARHFIVEQHPDVVVDVLDASNLERNLYLAAQLIEMQVPLVLAFNMSDVAHSRGLEFDLPQMEILLGARIVPMTATRGEGIEQLLDAVVQTAAQENRRIVAISYGREIEQELDGIEEVLKPYASALPRRYPLRWVALKLLEGDQEVQGWISQPDVCGRVEAAHQRLRTIFRDHPEITVAERRYGFISGACQETIKSTVQIRHDFSDWIDTVLTHRYLGLPIFAVLMFGVFYLTFRVGAWPMGWLERFFVWLGVQITQHWPLESYGWLRSLVVDGVIGGVGGVLIFLPNILLLFLGIAFLEDTGYMARAAFIMDRIMHKIGLHGKSFIPMLIGFGCSVPAIMATRILENRRNRLATMLVIPLMSCGARIAIYAIFAAALFPDYLRGPMMWLIYVIGIVLAIGCIQLLRRTLLKGETIPFVMELPPYRLPTLKGLAIHMWDRGWMYLKKAGTIILALSIILWAAISYPQPPAASLEGLSSSSQQQAVLQYSLAGRIGKALEPVVAPLGFDWKIATALIGASVAKEVFVSQLSIIYALGDTAENAEALEEHLRSDYTPLQGFCVMLFCLITAPCAATVAVTCRESGAWKWAALQYFGLTALAYGITFIVYQTGRLIF
ncbi:MAG TPA: ferrous iron transport protein B [Anaerohalosphaeraceae bacterium]|nr:ferrous iron transport protein B [Anaerohalosphaeraceae bacterium]HPO69995.1 ferrous iron transport protein B [Anaerohalosphaeraceae bacterium]HRS72151.1 ferrous iron transport protein B [Anaerohalosphaeraceae bacterium]HRV19364.1 ferrous iron transport protein B [Anaerohalosphaeraceae bacterium]